MREKGFTLLDTIVSMVILASVILLILNFNKYTFKTIDTSNQELGLIQEVHNTVTELYTVKNWGLLETNKNPDIQYTYKGKTQYNTEKLEIEVTFKDKIKVYDLERKLTE